MSADCTRWIDVADREALGEGVSDAELAFKLEHEAVCPECGSEAKIWRKLAEDPVAHASKPDAAAVDQVLATLRAQSQRAEPEKSRRSRRWIAAGSGLALAAGIALAVSWPKRPQSSNLPRPAVSVYLTLVTGKPASGPLLGEVGRGAAVSTLAGSACLRIEPAVRACTAENSEVFVASTELSNRRLDLNKGYVVVSLDPQPPGASLSVVTPHGKVTAKGTMFSVEIVEGTSVLRVAHGTVLAESPGRAPRSVHQNEKLVLGQADVDALSSPEAERDRSLIQRGSLWAGGSMATLEVPPTAAGTLVRLDGIALGYAPLSALVAPGPHRLELGDGEAEPVALAAGQHLVRGQSASPAPVAPAAPVRSLSAKPVPSASAAVEPPQPAPQLLQVARDLRGQGRLREAAEAYRALQAAHPSSAEARASMVSLGDVELALGDVDRALGSFDAYLAAGGPLAQEARYGKIRALTARGNVADAERETEEFLRLYPDSVQARALRKQK